MTVSTKLGGGKPVCIIDKIPSIQFRY